MDSPFAQLHGYLVCDPSPTVAYRGLDRQPVLPPGEQIDHFELVNALSRHLDADNFAATLADANEAREIYAETFKSDCDLLFVQGVACGETPLAAEPVRFLGVDISTPAPFASLLSGHPAWTERENVQTNEHGLLDSVARADEIIERRLAAGTVAPDDGFMAWYIFAIDES